MPAKQRTIYDCIVSPEKQAKRLMKGVRQLSVGVEAVVITVCTEKPEEADGIFALPLLGDLGVNFDINDPLGEGYVALADQLNLSNIRPGRFEHHLLNDFGDMMTPHQLWIQPDVRDSLRSIEATYGQPVKGRQRFIVVPVRTRETKEEVCKGALSIRQDHLSSGVRLPLGLVHGIALYIVWDERFSSHYSRKALFAGDQCTWERYTPDGRMRVPMIQNSAGERIGEWTENCTNISPLSVPVAYLK